MKVSQTKLNILMILSITLLIMGVPCVTMPGASSVPGSSSLTGGATAGKEAGGSTVNVISQNAIESNGNATQSFLDRLERRETITRIRTTIEKLKDQLGDIKSQVQNRLNEINASGII